jgi:hypothetical protein
MATPEYVVGIVVDPSFGERLHSVIARMPTWVVDTPANRAAAEAHWKTQAGETHTIGLTTFRVDPGQGPEEWCAEVLGLVIEHHGEYSHDPPVSVLEVIGARPVEQLVNALADYGFAQVSPTPEGFTARAA